MTTEQVIQRRLSQGATFRPDGAGITMELPGQPTSWTRRDLWDAATSSLEVSPDGFEAPRVHGDGAEQSPALVAFLALAVNRA